MGSYKTDGSGKQVKLEVSVVSPGDAAALVFIDGVMALESQPNFGGNIPATKVGDNSSLKGKLFKVQMATDLTTIDENNRKRALDMIKVTSTLEGGPEGVKHFSSFTTEREVIGNNEQVIYTKVINIK